MTGEIIEFVQYADGFTPPNVDQINESAKIVVTNPSLMIVNLVE